MTDVVATYVAVCVGTLPKEQLRKLQKLANTTTQAIEAERSNKRQKIAEVSYTSLHIVLISPSK